MSANAPSPEQVSAYLDGELPGGEALAVCAWLDAHPEALREVEHLRHLWDLLDRYGDEPVPEGFAGRVLVAAGTTGRREARGIPLARYRRALAVAAAVLLAAGVTVFVVARTGRTPQGGRAPEVAHLEGIAPEYFEDLDVLVEADDETFDAFLESADLADLPGSDR